MERNPLHMVATMKVKKLQELLSLIKLNKTLHQAFAPHFR